jgi:hypothetical protein
MTQRKDTRVDAPLTAVERLSIRPATLLTSNSNLRPHGIANWTIPAARGRFPDGRAYDTCESAGVCVAVCYARAGAYRFSNVLERHQRNLAYLLDDLDGWTTQMIREVRRRRARPVDCEVCTRSGYTVKVRIHDAGDFFSSEYTLAWREVIEACPGVLFYAYSKEVERCKRLLEPDKPDNLLLVYSLGGKQDALLDPAVDRVCEVFPTVDDLTAAGYHDQADCDLLAVLGPTPVGMGANNIPHLLGRLRGRTFGGWQRQIDVAKAARRLDDQTTASTSRSKEA